MGAMEMKAFQVRCHSVVKVYLCIQYGVAIRVMGEVLQGNTNKRLHYK